MQSWGEMGFSLNASAELVAASWHAVLYSFQVLSELSKTEDCDKFLM